MGCWMSWELNRKAVSDGLQKRWCAEDLAKLDGMVKR